MKNEKRKLIIEKAKLLFFKYGIKKVSVEEICSDCGISKKTFYNHFSNKYALIEVILDEFIEIDKKIFEKIKKEEITFKDKILKLTKEKMRKFESAETVFFVDVLENCDELKDYVSRVTSESNREFFLFVSQEQANNNLRKDLPASFIAHMLNDNATQLIFNTEVEKMLPDFNNRVYKVVDCLINGIEGGSDSS